MIPTDEKKDRVQITESLRNSLQELAELSAKEMSAFLAGSEDKANPRVKVAIAGLTNFSKIYQAENGQQRILIMALDMMAIKDPKDRKRYLTTTIPRLSLVNEGT